MKPDIKAKWVAALRSGKYQQGTRELRPTDDHFCCLGVLCDIYNKERQEVIGRDKEVIGRDLWESKAFLQDSDATGYAFNGHYDEALPPFVADWAGLSDPDPRINDYVLSEYNDGVGLPQLQFDAIADLIEEYL